MVDILFALSKNCNAQNGIEAILIQMPAAAVMALLKYLLDISNKFRDRHHRRKFFATLFRGR